MKVELSAWHFQINFRNLQELKPIPMAVMSDNGLKNQLDKRKLLLKKFRHQTFIICIIFFAIILASWLCLIDKGVTGTLLGTVIGSVFRFAYQPKSDKTKSEES